VGNTNILDLYHLKKENPFTEPLFFSSFFHITQNHKNRVVTAIGGKRNGNENSFGGKAYYV
jgi:hypothetical protein